MPIVHQQHFLKWLDGVLDAYAASPLALAHDGYATSGARLLGSTSLRFALHGWQRRKANMFIPFLDYCHDNHSQPQSEGAKYQSPWADKQYAAIGCNGPRQLGLSKIG